MRRHPFRSVTYRATARKIISEIEARGKRAIVVGGSGLYIKSLTHGLANLPSANRKLRDALEHVTTEELLRSFRTLDPSGAEQIDRQNKRRLVRAVEVCLLTGRPYSAQRTQWNMEASPGIFLFRQRADLYARINRRVEHMFEGGVVEEVRMLGGVG